MTKFITYINMTEDDKNQVSEMAGKITKWIIDRESIDYMSKQLNLDHFAVERNIDELIYLLKKQVGIKRFLRILFWR